MKFLLKQNLTHRPIIILSFLLSFLLIGGLAPAVAAQNACGESYTVVYRDTLRKIAQRCDTTVPALVQANPNITNPNFIYTGQQLTIPTSPEEPPASAITYRVRPGDTLNRIAARFDTTVPAILSANPGITNRNLIYVNQLITIPSQQPQQPDQGAVTISPTSGPPGTQVQLTAQGFPANTVVEIGVGRRESEYTVSNTVQTDAQGRLNIPVTIPTYADPNEPWVVVVTTRGAPPEVEGTSNTFFTTGQSSPGAPTFDQVDIFLVALEEGDIGCGDRLVPVTRNIPPTQAPLTAAIQELLSIEERTYGQSGLYNALYQSDLHLEDIDLENGRAVIRLRGDFSMGGVCDVPRYQAQLRQTALQFETVDEVEFIINGSTLEALASAR